VETRKSKRRIKKEKRKERGDGKDQRVQSKPSNPKVSVSYEKLKWMNMYLQNRKNTE